MTTTNLESLIRKANEDAARKKKEKYRKYWAARESCILFIQVRKEARGGVALESSPALDMVKICVGLIVIEYWGLHV